MEPNDDFRNVHRKEQNISSSDDDDVLPLRKKMRTDSVSDESSSQEDYDTCSEQYSQETLLTAASVDTTEELGNVAENGDQQDSVVSIVTDNNNGNSLAINTHELQTDINDSISDDTNTNSAVNLESTMQPETRYVIPENLLYRPCISDFTMKHNLSNSAYETINNHDKSNITNDIFINIEQIRQDFIRAWDRILAAGDLIPETELVTLNSTTPDKICQYLNELSSRNSRNETLRLLIPKVYDEIHNLQERDDSVDEFDTFEPEPEPIPISDFLSDPLDLIETDRQQSTTGEDYEFDIDHWYRIQHAFIMPEHIPEFDELFTNNGIVIPNSIENGPRDDSNVDYQSLTDVPNELAHIYATIIRETAINQHTNVSTLGQSATERVQSEDSYLPNFLHSDSNNIQLNYDADLYRSVLGITSPFQRNANTFNEEIAMHVQNASSPVHTLNRPVETEGVPTQIFSSLSEVESSPAEFALNIVELDSALVDFETNPAELETNPSEMQSNPVEIETNPNEIETNAEEMETNPTDMETNPNEIETNANEMVTNPNEMETNPVELNASPVELTSNPVVFGTNSNQNDSDASIAAAFNAYDGSAQFVVVPGHNDYKPLKIYIVNPNAAGTAHAAHNVPTEETTSDENSTMRTAQEETNDEEEINGVYPGNFQAMQEMNHFEAEISTIETEINVIMEEADRFEQQAARFENTAGDFQEVEGFFRQISEIFEFAAMSLQEAIDNFEAPPIEETSDVANELDPISEGIAVEDENVLDQEVPDIEHSGSCKSKSSRK